MIFPEGHYTLTVIEELYSSLCGRPSESSDKRVSMQCPYANDISLNVENHSFPVKS